MRNSDFHTQDVKRVCENKLGIAFRNGSEFNGWYSQDGKRVARITIPKGRKDIPPKTYKSMASQLKLNVDDFDRLLDCPLKLDEYRKLVSAFLATLVAGPK